MKDVTYGQFVCTVRPEKSEPNQTRFTVGGDRINYPDATADPVPEKESFNLVALTMTTGSLIPMLTGDIPRIQSVWDVGADTL